MEHIKQGLDAFGILTKGIRGTIPSKYDRERRQTIVSSHTLDQLEGYVNDFFALSKSQNEQDRKGLFQELNPYGNMSLTLLEELVYFHAILKKVQVSAQDQQQKQRISGKIYELCLSLTDILDKDYVAKQDTQTAETIFHRRCPDGFNLLMGVAKEFGDKTDFVSKIIDLHRHVFLPKENEQPNLDRIGLLRNILSVPNNYGFTVLTEAVFFAQHKQISAKLARLYDQLFLSEKFCDIVATQNTLGYRTKEEIEGSQGKSASPIRHVLNRCREDIQSQSSGGRPKRTLSYTDSSESGDDRRRRINHDGQYTNGSTREDSNSDGGHEAGPAAGYHTDRSDDEVEAAPIPNPLVSLRVVSAR